MRDSKRLFLEPELPRWNKFPRDMTDGEIAMWQRGASHNEFELLERERCRRLQDRK